jgi:hypothetical protein
LSRIAAVFATLLIIGLGWGALSATQAALKWQVYAMTQQCRAETLLYASHNKVEVLDVSCALGFWDGGVAHFDVTGALKGTFWCRADEADHSFGEFEGCTFKPEAQ